MIVIGSACSSKKKKGNWRDIWMGNQRFKLSDMMPNAWFYKLRDMSKVKVQVQARQRQPGNSSCSSVSFSPNPKFCERKRQTVYMPSPSHHHSNSDIIIDITPPIHTASRNSFSAGVKIRPRKNPQSRRPRKNKNKNKNMMFHSESFAIVKASFDPHKDFKESMMEMIIENNLTHSKDLEDLLACYLSLNSNQYHHIIINAFQQIWFTMPQHHFT